MFKNVASEYMVLKCGIWEHGFKNVASANIVLKCGIWEHGCVDTSGGSRGLLRFPETSEVVGLSIFSFKKTVQ